MLTLLTLGNKTIVFLFSFDGWCADLLRWLIFDHLFNTFEAAPASAERKRAMTNLYLIWKTVSQDTVVANSCSFHSRDRHFLLLFFSKCCLCVDLFLSAEPRDLAFSILFCWSTDRWDFGLHARSFACSQIRHINKLLTAQMETKINIRAAPKMEMRNPKSGIEQITTRSWQATSTNSISWTLRGEFEPLFNVVSLITRLQLHICMSWTLTLYRVWHRESVLMQRAWSRNTACTGPPAPRHKQYRAIRVSNQPGVQERPINITHKYALFFCLRKQ